VVGHEIGAVGDEVEWRILDAVMALVGLDAAAEAVAALERDVDDGTFAGRAASGMGCRALRA
jgi:hypothetical protein